MKDVAPLACYAFIKIKLASRHLLTIVVYTCQKSFHFISAFAYYKQKCKLVPFNLAHPVLTTKMQVFDCCFQFMWCAKIIKMYIIPKLFMRHSWVMF